MTFRRHFAASLDIMSSNMHEIGAQDMRSKDEIDWQTCWAKMFTGFRDLPTATISDVAIRAKLDSLSLPTLKAQATHLGCTFDPATSKKDLIAKLLPKQIAAEEGRRQNSLSEGPEQVLE